jgi:23S rRNA pseudouridine1911/1915/1917 synthase
MQSTADQRKSATWDGEKSGTLGTLAFARVSIRCTDALTALRLRRRNDRSNQVSFGLRGWRAHGWRNPHADSLRRPPLHRRQQAGAADDAGAGRRAVVGGDGQGLHQEKYAKPAGVYLGIPHRLDRPVSGIVVFARNTKAASRLAEQFQQHSVEKVYWAKVEGIIADDAGEWRDHIRKVKDEARAEIVSADAEGAKEAITLFRVLRRDVDATLIELTPKTGRMHQLRVQAAARGHPVLGDNLYESTRSFGPPAELSRDRVIALHARRLVFQHPFRKAPVEIEAPLPDYWGDE